MSPSIFANSDTKSPLDGLRRRLTSKFQIFWADKGIPKSPLRHLLKSNIAPSDLEILTIRALITDAEARIWELQSHTPTRASKAKAQTQLLEFIQAHKALLSPVRCLPPEIVQEIFLHYCARRIQVSHSPHSVVPWNLGHISHRWREIALSLPSLWDNIPGIHLCKSSHAKSFRLRALTCLIQRSGSSPTLKFHIFYQTTRIIGHPILQKIIAHSERISCLRLRVYNLDITARAFEGLRGRLSNLRILTLDFCMLYLCPDNLDESRGLFKNAPALMQVTLRGSHRGDRTGILQLPWSQITHFIDMLACNGSDAPSVPLSILTSLTHLYIDKGYTPTSYPHKPVTLPRLRYFKLILDHHCHGDKGVFLKSLTMPSIETIHVFYLGSLVPRLTSMLSRSHEPSCLHTLAFRTLPLQRGELSSLLNLTPYLIRLDIDVPPTDDILRLIDHEARLVPMLRALCMHHYASVSSTQAGFFNRLAQVRCESGGTLGLRLVFNSSKNQDASQIILNNWSPLFSPEETEAVKILTRWRSQLRRDLFENYASIPNHKQNYNYLEMLDQFFACIEQSKAITVNVLRETHIHIDLQRIIVGNWLMIPGQDKLKARAMSILDGWERLLSNSLDGYCWARTSSQQSDNFSLIYVPKDNRHDALSIIYGLKPLFKETSWETSWETCGEWD